MEGTLQHSPADILRYLLIVHGMGSLPSGVNNSDWSIFVDNEPDRPDNCITVYNTPSIQQGRIQPTGQMIEYFGTQVRVRSQESRTGFNKIREIAVELDEDVLNEVVDIGSASYCVQSYSRLGSILSFGKDAPTPTKRHIHTFNGYLIVKQNIIGTGF